ncbi:S9 family peptidase [Halobacteriales archaeon QS_1_68_20]|nr:MAG: S9 family peptidase [Halobacteriales archaeon QS_1_68_20]
MRPPETPRHEDAYEYHGERIEDPYLWLEDGDGDAVREWVASQNEYADAHLADAPADERLRPRFEELARARDYHGVTPTAGGYFQRIRDPEQDQAVLYALDEPGGERRELVDPNEFSEDGTVSMNWYVPSPDGDLVAYGVDEGGQENYDVHVLDVETGEDVEVLESLGRTNAASLAWKGEGFYYVATGSDDDQLDKELRYHELGADQSGDAVIADEFAPETWPAPVTDRESDRVVVADAAGWERTDLYYREHGETDLRDLVVGVDAIFEPILSGEDLYLRTTYDAPNFRLARLDLTDPPEDPDDLETVIPEDEAILRATAVADDRLLVKRDRDAVAELSVHDRDGTHLTDVDLPGTGTVSALAGHPGDRECFFRYQSFDQPPSVYRRADGEVEPIGRPAVEAEVDLVVRQERCESADGTELPVFVVHREGLERDGDNPALVTGYGGFDVNMTPQFRRYALPFLAGGGVFAQAVLRGGGEYGDDWHDAARRERKEHTFEDFVAAAEHLVDAGYTSPGRLGCAGGSNGGLTVGAAITRRPDLFAACHCAVPLLDMLRFHRSLLGRSWTVEYGNPEEDPDAFEYVRAYSPYHNVEEQAYPAVLFTTARGDTRVDPFHAWKMAARMQRRQRGDAPILLRTRDSTGHGVGKPVSMIVDEQVEEWGFLYEHLDVEW